MFYRCSGVGRVLENLLVALIEFGGMEEIHTILPVSMRKTFLNQFPSPKVKPLFVPYGPMGYGDLIRKGRVLRSLVGKVGLFFFPGHNVPLMISEKYIMTVHDLTVFSPYSRISAIRKAGFRFLLSRSLSRADKIITVSQTTRSELVREFSVPEEKVAVIHNWIDDCFLSPPVSSGPLRSPVDGDYLLFLGLRIPHKNLEGLIRAFLLLAGEYPDLKLVIAGGRHSAPDMVDRWKRDPRLAGRLVEILDPTDEQIVRLFAGAKVFVFPSFAEGFGLPPLEAMASGVPVVCSDIPVFREVYGDAVLYVDPTSPGSIAGGVRRVLMDSDFSTDLRWKGKERADLYRGDWPIQKYLDLVGNVWGRRGKF